MEYQAVGMVGLHEGSLPHYQARADEDIAEAKRLFLLRDYACKTGFVLITDDLMRNGISRFLCPEIGALFDRLIKSNSLGKTHIHDLYITTHSLLKSFCDHHKESLDPPYLLLCAKSSSNGAPVFF
jgi:hypothetical protein